MLFPEKFKTCGHLGLSFEDTVFGFKGTPKEKTPSVVFLGGTIWEGHLPRFDTLSAWCGGLPEVPPTLRQQTQKGRQWNYDR